MWLSLLPNKRYFFIEQYSWEKWQRTDTLILRFGGHTRLQEFYCAAGSWFSFQNHDHDRDWKLFRKKRDPFFIFWSSCVFSQKNALRFFCENRIAIELSPSRWGCRRGACRLMYAQVVNFSQTDRDFSGKIDPCFFRQKRSAIFIVKSRSRSRLKIIPEKTGSVFHF